MEIHEALDQIHEIHAHLAKGEIYRDYRALPVALSGVLALAAAAFAPPLTRLLPSALDPGQAFIIYWIAIGVVGALVAGGGILRAYITQSSPDARRRTRIVTGQLVPSIAAGVLVTAVLGRLDPPAVAWLPGLWTILYSLGVFASRPYLPRIIGWIALYYFIAGGALLALAPAGHSLSPWGVGGAFGLGQLLTGLVLYWNLERNPNES